MWKRPESVLVVICTDAGEVLLLRRREPDGYWQSVTGSLAWGEAALGAARREVFEETGLFADAGLEDTGVINEFPIVPPWTERYAPGTATNRERVYLLRLGERPPVVLNPAEHLEARWLPAAEAAALASSASNREAIRRLLKIQN